MKKIWNFWTVFQGKGDNYIMGFFDSLGDALGKGASSAMNSLMEKERKIENYVEKYQYRDDEFLIRKYKHPCWTEEKIAIVKLMKERGYGNS